jgi:hypothetical protein
MSGRSGVGLVAGALLGLAVLLMVGGIFGAAPEISRNTAGEEEHPQDTGVFVHTVLFWLNDGVDETEKRELIEDCRSLLGSISTVRYLAVGIPADTPRGVVDNSYQVGLVVHFDDTAGHDHYQEAEKHLEFIERNQEKWRRVQVYDIQTE